MQNILKSSLFILALAVSSASFAQQPQAASQSSAPPAVAPHRQPNPAHETKALAKRLGLSPDQTAQVQPVFAERQQRMQTLMNDSTVDPKSMRQQRRAIMADTEQKLNAVLTPAQQQQYAAMRAQRHHVQGGTQPAPAPTA